MVFFPSQINKNNKTLVTYVHAGVCWIAEHIYGYNDITGKWSEKSHKIIDICKK